MRGATTSASNRRIAFSYFFFGPRCDFFFSGSGVAAFFKSAKKSPRSGTGMSCPVLVFCVLAMFPNHVLKFRRARHHLDEFRRQIRDWFNQADSHSEWFEDDPNDPNQILIKARAKNIPAE